MNFSELAHERHSVRHYTPGLTISDAELEAIFGEVILSPSSFNLQPWQFVVVREPARKQALKNLAFYQQQLEDSAAAIVVCGKLDAHQDTVRIYADAPAPMRDKFVPMIPGVYEGQPALQRDEAVRGRLRRLVAAFLLRRTKAQVLPDLPPRTEIIHRVEPGPEERSFLEAARRSAVERVANMGADVGDGQAAFHVLAELTRLRRAACDPRLVAPELGIVGAKSQEFEQLAIELVAGRHKALVFSQFTDFLKLLAERLDSAGISYQYLDGSTPAAERARRVVAFQRGEGDLFLISLKAGGFGLNLTGADYVIHLDPWWNPAVEQQASDRAHRIGQTRPVTVYRLVTAGTIEERFVALHRDKRELADAVLADTDRAASLSAAELRGLLES